MAHCLLNLPHEVLHCIFTNVDPLDLPHLSCCRALNAFIKSDRLLYKELYLNTFDDPRRKGDHGEPAWKDDLYKLANAGRILKSTDMNLKKAQIKTITQSVDHLLHTAAAGSQHSQNIAFLAHHFHDNKTNIDVFLSGSSLFEWAEKDAWSHHPSCFADEVAEAQDPEAIYDADDESERHERGPEEVDQDQAYEHDYVPFGVDQHQNIVPSNSSRPVPGSATVRSVDPAIIRQRQLSAKLHCLYGVPINHVRRSSASGTRYALRSDTAPLHPYARSMVYDLRQHTDNTLWGPYMEEEYLQVNWEKMESIIIILHHNITEFAKTHDLKDKKVIPSWDKPFEGASPYSYVSAPISVLMEPSIPLEAKDPYNVTGTWMRVVCFLDYTELFDFNFATAPHYYPSDRSRPALDTEEAIRLITMKIQVTKVEKPSEEDGQDLPVVYFKGSSSSVRPSWDANANSKIRGVVRLTPHGDVRWTTWSIFHGEERWRSEGVQLGSVQSARGVIGFWFDKDFDEHGPAGPTAFWKLHDGIEVPQSRTNLFQPSLHYPLT